MEQKNATEAFAVWIVEAVGVLQKSVPTKIYAATSKNRHQPGAPRAVIKKYMLERHEAEILQLLLPDDDQFVVVFNAALKHTVQTKAIKQIKNTDHYRTPDFVVE